MTHNPQPVHFSSLTTIAPALFLAIAPGTGQAFKHMPHCTQTTGLFTKRPSGPWRTTWIVALDGACVLWCWNEQCNTHIWQPRQISGIITNAFKFFNLELRVVCLD